MATSIQDTGMYYLTPTELSTKLAADPTYLGERSRLLASYALCGFANFGSLGIMVGGLGTMCPARRAEVVALGMKSIVAGTLATCMTGAVVGMLWGD